MPKKNLTQCPKKKKLISNRNFYLGKLLSHTKHKTVDPEFIYFLIETNTHTRERENCSNTL